MTIAESTRSTAMNRATEETGDRLVISEEEDRNAQIWNYGKSSGMAVF